MKKNARFRSFLFCFSFSGSTLPESEVHLARNTYLAEIRRSTSSPLYVVSLNRRINARYKDINIKNVSTQDVYLELSAFSLRYKNMLFHFTLITFTALETIQSRAEANILYEARSTPRRHKCITSCYICCTRNLHKTLYIRS